jgi:hypothetical protein
MRPHSPANIRLGCKWLAGENALAYITSVSITVVKSFIALHFLILKFEEKKIATGRQEKRY